MLPAQRPAMVHQTEVPLGGDARQGVSVVMIFLDPGTFFAEAVESVLAQTHTDIELLLCDDGSSDGSSTLAQRYVQTHPDRVRYLEHPGHANHGMSETRNLGITHARKELVAFLDADDKWLPDHLTRQVQLLSVNPDSSAVCGGAVTWLSWLGDGAMDSAANLAWPTGTRVPPPLMLEALLNRPETRTPTCSLLVRRSTLLSLGGAENRFRGMFEDQALLAKLFVSTPVVIGDGGSALYRQHEGSSSAAAVRSGQYAPWGPNAARDEWLRWLREYLAGLPEPRTHVAELIDVQLDQRHRPSRSTARLRRTARDVVQRLSPQAARLSRRVSRTPPGRLVKRIQFGAAGTRPVSTSFGYDRGTPIDRYFIEGFLSRSSYLIRGAVLEVGDDSYTRRFGGTAVTSADVLNVRADPGTTIVGDLERAGALPRDRFDCVVLTQTLHLLWDLSSAIDGLYEALHPGGVVLATFPFISQISDDRWAEQWLWGISPLAARRLFEHRFGVDRVQIESFGNVRSATAFLQGFTVEDVPSRTLDRDDPRYPMLVAVRAWRPREQA